MEYTIPEFAEFRGISLQRARQLAREGKVPARRDGRAWIITGLEAPRRTRRRLGGQTRADLLVYLGTRTLDHVTGMRKRRLANAVRQIRRADDPSSLIREYFDGAEEPRGPGGAAVVRAALRGLDEAANAALRMQHRLVIQGAEELGKRILEARILTGLSAAQLALRAGVSLETVQLVERASSEDLTQAIARKLADAMDLQVVKMSLRSGVPR